MGLYFDDAHASCESQLAGAPCHVGDTPDISALRGRARTGEDYAALGDALGRQLRYLDSARAYTRALSLLPGDARILRKRAGRYLSTLRPEEAEADFKLCAGADAVDVPYRLGLCAFFSGRYASAAARLEGCVPLCGDEMAVAIMYWHTISAWRAGAAPALLPLWRKGMDVGHHLSYDRALALFAGEADAEGLLRELEGEEDDMEYSIVLYGLCAFLEHEGERGRALALREKLLSRDRFWISYAYLAAYNDARGDS